jgi:hypothetical protein
MHCGEAFAQHTLRGETRWCPNGTQQFNVEFQANPEVIDFVKANSDKSSAELAELWIKRVTKRKP